MTSVLRLALAGVLLGSSGSIAHADTITATAQGWCSATQCNNTGTSPLQNTFAGSREGDEYRNWFAFELPVSGDITAAALSIWNESANFTLSATATFELRNAASVSFGGLLGTTTLGSLNVREADEGGPGFVSIALNAEALMLLNAARGGQFLFGGVVTPFLPTTEVQIFGYTTGPPAAFLSLATEAAPVPEPSAFVLLILGGAVIALGRERRLMLARVLVRH